MARAILQRLLSRFPSAPAPPIRPPDPRIIRAAMETLEERRLLAVTMVHNPYLQQGNAPLVNMPGSTTDQVQVLWQTTGAIGTDVFTVQYRVHHDVAPFDAFVNTNVAF